MTPPPTNPSKTHSITLSSSSLFLPLFTPPSLFYFFLYIYIYIYSPFLLPSHNFKPLVTLTHFSMPPLSTSNPLHHPFQRDTLSLSLSSEGLNLLLLPTHPFFLFLGSGLLLYMASQGAYFFFLFGTTLFVCVFPCLSFSPNKTTKLLPRPN